MSKIRRSETFVQFVRLGAQVMKMDARFQPFSRTMDICLIFRKK